MERIVNVATSFAEADEWDIQQCLAMTPAERQRAAKMLKLRLFPQASDVRDCLRYESTQPTFRKTFRSSSDSSTSTTSDF